MEAWRQRPLGGRKLVHQESQRIHLTPTGLLMEGDSPRNPCFEKDWKIRRAMTLVTL